MSRLELFRKAKDACNGLVAWEMEPVWRPIKEQLDYLILFESGEDVDRSLLQNVDIGLQALRNLDDVYPDVAKMLFEVQRQAEQMAVENGMKNRISL